jgi:hypothetical protein
VFGSNVVCIWPGAHGARCAPELRKRSRHFPLALAPETPRSNLATRPIAPLFWCHRGPGDERPHFVRGLTTGGSS